MMINTQKITRYALLIALCTTSITHGQQLGEFQAEYGGLWGDHDQNSSLLHLTYYQILQVPEDANNVQIQNAFKALIMQHHPDKNPQNTQTATEISQQIINANYVLKNTQKRTIYDNSLQQGMPEVQARIKAQ